ncbi:MAG TPA: hypothetical protein VFP91_20535 [Vicinamibacterales bacterium]|nr:hypothetical protein [Vicinamibacterales bacterium]
MMAPHVQPNRALLAAHHRQTMDGVLAVHRLPPFVLGLLLTAVALAPMTATESSLNVLEQFGLSSQQIAAIEDGKAVAKALPWGGPSEVYLFGAVRVNGSPSAYLLAARGIKQVAGAEGYFGIGELWPNATVNDLEALTLEADDIKALKTCRESACDVQLPSASISAFQTLNWSDPAAPAQANRLARQMLIQLFGEYRRGGNVALGVYQDKAHPALVARQFETMVSRASALPDVLPELRDYLLHYPNAELPGADSFFYWEKVSFGLKPTIRLNHAVIYHTRRQGRDVDVVAIKQLYASHYFHTALDLSVCVADGDSHGFYLVTVKGSEQEGLTGLKGSILRKIVVDKSRSSLEDALTSIKQSLEAPSASGLATDNPPAAAPSSPRRSR